MYCIGITQHWFDEIKSYSVPNQEVQAASKAALDGLGDQLSRLKLYLVSCGCTSSTVHEDASGARLQGDLEELRSKQTGACLDKCLSTKNDVSR